MGGRVKGLKRKSKHGKVPYRLEGQCSQPHYMIHVTIPPSWLILLALYLSRRRPGFASRSLRLLQYVDSRSTFFSSLLTQVCPAWIKYHARETPPGLGNSGQVQCFSNLALGSYTECAVPVPIY